MKMLYVADDLFPPFRADVVDLFAREIVGRGHRVDWMMRRGPSALGLPARTEWLGSKIYLSPALPGAGLFSRLLNVLLEAWGDLGMLRIALHERYDVIIVRDRFLVTLLAWLACRLTGARLAYWMSYPFADSKLEQARSGFARYPVLTRWKARFIDSLLFGLALPLSDHVFVQSDRMLEDVSRRGVARQRMTPVPMGVHQDYLATPADAREPNTQAPVLLYLGVAMRLRQTEMLVGVLAKVRARYPAARLVYVGSGLEAADLRAIDAEVDRLGLQGAVTVTGFLPRDEALAHVRRADVCLSPIAPIPALLPASPTKLVEYLALAKSVVANQHPDQSAMLEASGAGTPVEWTEDAFAAGVIALLDAPAVARERAALGPEYVRKHRTYAVLANQVEATLRRLVGSARLG